MRQNVLQASKLRFIQIHYQLCTQVAKGRVRESSFAPYVMQSMMLVTFNVFNKFSSN